VIGGMNKWSYVFLKAQDAFKRHLIFDRLKPEYINRFSFFGGTVDLIQSFALDR
jgi:hypothetical protein